MDLNTIRKVMQEMGRKGGKIGGKRSLETMTPAQRRARAKKAAAASAKVRSAKAKAKRANGAEAKADKLNRRESSV